MTYSKVYLAEDARMNNWLALFTTMTHFQVAQNAVIFVDCLRKYYLLQQNSGYRRWLFNYTCVIVLSSSV
jgi:hypothetical protein